ncbi:MAG TPA: hypothetical protein VGQ78_05945 [Vicinamibacteria bacterium]|nr:hypothetical protein [Vicinamibacteria bacterium]
MQRAEHDEGRNHRQHRGRALNFGLRPSEAAALRRLTPPWRIQRFLDGLDYDVDAEGCRSPRRVLRERKVQCMDGALFGAAALRFQGHPPLLVDLEGVWDTDHVLAVFRTGGGWGAIARSNFSGLRYREPIHRTIRELVLTYVESYFNLRRQKTLRRYSVPVNLRRFDRRGWMSAEEDLWYLPDHLLGVRHFRLLTPAQEKRLATVDRRMFEAGLVGRED